MTFYSTLLIIFRINFNNIPKYYVFLELELIFPITF